MASSHGNIFDNYFMGRNVNPGLYVDYVLPKYIWTNIPTRNNTKILEIGCGFGHMLKALKDRGYSYVKGIDISVDAIAYCKEMNLNVELISDIEQFCNAGDERYDVIIMSHVLEHLPKDSIVNTLAMIKDMLMDLNGILLAMVPNAQANTGCYWAYEDFTHSTMFTAGSVSYVMKAAGFDKIIFLDKYGLEDCFVLVRIIKMFFLVLYVLNIKFWNFITNSSFHRPSPSIFTYELKVLAR